MSQVSGANQSVRGSQAGARGARLGWIPALLALTVAAASFPLLVSSCAELQNYPAADGGATTPTSGSSGGPTCIGPECAGACETPGPGCACDIEGQHLACGKVEATYPTVGGIPGSTVCGTGWSTCTNKQWSECEISGTTTIPNAPAGYYAQGLGANGTACTANPCDPQCSTFVDTPTALDAGAGLTATDAGIVITGAPIPCVPKTCATLGYNCGPQTDGCGNGINCGTCTFPATCGGAGQASVCGVNPACTNYCPHQTGTTSIHGTVYMPNGTTPLVNALVYVPNISAVGVYPPALTAFTSSVACVTAGNCTSEASGDPLVATTSAVDGTFTLANVPAGVAFPVVIQLGRFRRVFQMAAVTAGTNALVPCTTPAACLSRFPRSQNETTIYDNIPKMAFSTGCVDALECVWRKVGIASTGNSGLGGNAYNTGEFSPGNTAGRINFYAGGGCPGTYLGNYGGTTPWDTALVGNLGLMNEYDVIIFPCQGNQYYYGPQATQVGYQSNITSYVNNGGRVFASHYSYIWLITNGGFGSGAYSSALSPAINWSINGAYNGSDPATGYINQTFAGGSTLANWMMVPAVAGSTTLGQMTVNTIRHDFTGVNAAYSTQLWVTLSPGGQTGIPMQASFTSGPSGLTTPSASQCGKVVYSDFHVENSGNTQYSFPTECPGGGFSPQEFMLAQSLFDLAGCVSTLTVPSCTPLTCAALGVNCGSPGDGCGGTLSCGTCTAPATCGGGGVTNTCGTQPLLNPHTFERDYNASTTCPAGQSPVWRLFSWGAITPGNSEITFQIGTATTQALLASATLYPLQWSTPVPGVPGGATAGAAVMAHAINVPSAGLADTETNGASPDYTFTALNLPRTNNFVRVVATLNPTSNQITSPTLSTWNMQIDCVDNQ
jgi:hypothetical protein